MRAKREKPPADSKIRTTKNGNVTWLERRRTADGKRYEYVRQVVGWAFGDRGPGGVQ